MKMVLARLRVLTLKVRITLFVMIMAHEDETWMNGNWFYTTNCGIFGNGGKAIERSPPIILHNG